MGKATRVKRREPSKKTVEKRKWKFKKEIIVNAEKKKEKKELDKEGKRKEKKKDWRKKEK